jgi:hypothetical protein
MGLGHLGAKLLFISLGILGLIAVIIAMTATSTDQKIPAWIAKLVPGRGNGLLQDGIKCYGLPYGAIGFVSHILTYCTIFSLDLSRSPAKLVWNIIGNLACFPCCENVSVKLDFPWFDFTLALISLTLTVASSSLSIIRCRNEWPLVLIATWKMLLSLDLGFTAVHRAIEIRKRDHQGPKLVEQRRFLFLGSAKKSERERKPSKLPAVWNFLYAIGIIIGLAGLSATISEVWHTRTNAMKIITIVFGVVVLLPVCVLGVASWLGCGKKLGILFAGSAAGSLGLVMVGILAAFYSDWMLAAIEVQKGGSWAGLPTADANWLYWSYFAGKRLPSFSI